MLTADYYTRLAEGIADTLHADEWTIEQANTLRQASYLLRRHASRLTQQICAEKLAAQYDEHPTDGIDDYLAHIRRTVLS